MLFLKLLEKQLVLKGIMTVDDWNTISGFVKFDYAKDNYFSELKDAEILETRVNLARNLQDMTGKYISHVWVRKNVLQQSDDDIANMDQEITAENQSQDPRWLNPTIEQNLQMMQQQAAAEQQQQQQLQAGQQQPPEDEDAQRREAVRQAMVTVDQMKKKKGNRSMQDEAAYKAAVQVVAKNPEVVKQIGGTLQ